MSEKTNQRMIDVELLKRLFEYADYCKGAWDYCEGRTAVICDMSKLRAIIDGPGVEPVALPSGLHYETKRLVVQFAAAMAEKLYAAELKYGYSNGWSYGDWMDECRAKLLEHLAKGDPRDVANYCAFLWYHKEPTIAPSAPVQTVPDWRLEAARRLDAAAQPPKEIEE